MTGFESVRRSLMEHAVINFILGPNSPKSRLIDVSCHETDDCDVFFAATAVRDGWSWRPVRR